MVAIVGESGSGKSVSALAVMRLLPPGTARTQGSVRFNGRELLHLSEEEMRRIRGREIAMIFQEPMTSLNPVLKIGLQIMEPLVIHLNMDDAAARARAIELLTLVGITDPESRLNQYPHQLSGGMRQRVMIAIGLACNPKLLIADEPTTALDVTIQAQILDLLAEMKDKFGMAIMLITHAMGVVAEVAQRVAVMYAGRVVEEAPVEELFARPLHPYTQGLIRSIPRLDKGAKGVGGRKRRLDAISGTVPSLLTPPPGCRFAPRCTFAKPSCTEAVPELRTVGPNHKVACILYPAAAT
jgi:peptide/nickel transport system ATP-binding protein